MVGISSDWMVFGKAAALAFGPRQWGTNPGPSAVDYCTSEAGDRASSKDNKLEARIALGTQPSTM